MLLLYEVMDIKKYFRYDNGFLYWTAECESAPLRGKRAGYLDHRAGYWFIRISGKKYYFHRIVWQFHNGAIPRTKFLDHINRDKLDNRIENLRLVTPAQNSWNKSADKDKKSAKYKGVCRLPIRCKAKKYEARIKKHGKSHFLGCYATQEEAALAYNKKALELFGEHAALNDIG